MLSGPLRMPCSCGSESRPVPAQNLTMPRLPPEHKARPPGHAGWRRASRAAPVAQASAARADAPQGMERVRARARRHGVLLGPGPQRPRLQQFLARA
eukprot:9258696-Lingulodinium_polyedra.AAC.1